VLGRGRPMGSARGDGAIFVTTLRLSIAAGGFARATAAAPTMLARVGVRAAVVTIRGR